MELGASLRFVYPTDSQHVDFQREERNLPPGGFLQTPQEDFRPKRQAVNFLQAAKAVNEAGMDLLLVGDRHAVPINAFSPIPLLARLMAVTGSMPVGCLFLAPFYQPILLAEQLGTLSALSEGPLIAAFAIGDNEAQFSAFNMALKSRTVRTDEVVEIVRRLLSGESVTFEGRYHRLENVGIGPLPESAVPIWIGGRRGAAVERAGRLGDAWISDTRCSDEELSEELQRYQQAATQSERTPKAVLRRNILVAETDAEARKTVEAILTNSYRGLSPDRVLSGSARTVTEKLLAYEEMGFAVTIVRHLAGDHTMMLDSVGHIGAGVMPLLKALRGNRANPADISRRKSP
jgi:alkanesulfonate monooxygenase SsuD/methylene tetrahydromethanopterin reductase-like flavin-dependent oxidoreductase (luciferase family)